MEEEGRDMDIRKKINRAFPYEKVHVTVQAEMLCCFVHLKCFPDELSNDKQTHDCTESDLDGAYNLGQDRGTDLLHAKR